MVPSEVGSFRKGMLQFKVPLKPQPPDSVTFPPSTCCCVSDKSEEELSDFELVEGSEKVSAGNTNNDMDENYIFKVYSFYTKNLSRPLLKAIEETAPNWYPTPIQKSIIPAALLGFDICAVTSFSRTAAFTLPVLERLICMPAGDDMTRVVVIVPTRESGVNMINTISQLAKFTSVKVALFGGDETSQISNPDIVVATPSTLIGHAIDSLDLENIKV